MSEKQQQNDSKNNASFFGKLKEVVGKKLQAISVVAGALAILPFIASTFGWFKELNTVDLPDAFEGEVWRDASIKKIEWMEGEWFYPSLPDFYTRFKIENKTLYQQNEGLNPDAFITEWISVEVFVSDKGTLRLRYVSNDWPGTFIHKQENKDFEFHNNERYIGDDGTVTAGKKRLVLKRDRCIVSRNGETYECK